MKLPDWLKPKTASLAELTEQLAAAQAALAEANATVQAAEEAYDDIVSETTQRARDKALADAKQANGLVARAMRLLQRAQEAEIQKDRVVLRARRDALEPVLSRAGVLETTAHLARAEAEALSRVAEIRLQRLDARDSLRAFAFELTKIRGQLGEPLGDAQAEVSFACGHTAVDALLQERIEALPDRHPLRQLLERAKPGNSWPYEVQQYEGADEARKRGPQLVTSKAHEAA